MADEKDIKVRELEARNELSRIAYNQIEGRIEKLKAENAELREALKHEVNLNAMNLRQCEKLKAENAELRHNFEQDRKVIANLKAQLSESQKKVEGSIDFIVVHGGIDGAHHKDWVLDQIVRKLSGDNYSKIIADAKAGEDGPDTYEWEEGIAP